MTARRTVVEMTGVMLEFPRARVLDCVDLTLYPGEVHALVARKAPASRYSSAR